jgi:carboxylesterase
LPGGPVGILLIHGFTGAPPEMRLVGECLQERGLTVSGPRLPGHGTRLDDLNRRRWQEWTDHVDEALAELENYCEKVFAAGLSMGALLALHLAARRPELAGVAAYSPAIIPADWRSKLAPILKHLIRQVAKGPDDLHDPRARERIWSYDAWPGRGAHELMKLAGEVKRLLPQVRCPALVMYSTADKSIHPNSAPYTYERLGSKDKQLLILHHSGHVITVDGEWEQVADRTYQFIEEVNQATPLRRSVS